MPLFHYISTYGININQFSPYIMGAEGSGSIKGIKLFPTHKWRALKWFFNRTGKMQLFSINSQQKMRMREKKCCNIQERHNILTIGEFHISKGEL